MAKILTTITSCRDCSHSVLFQSSEAQFSIIACAKNESVLKIVRKNGNYDCDIPNDCPLPDFKE